MTVDPTMATDPQERASLVHQMERLREMINEGEISEREGDRQYSQLACRLLGEVAWRDARARARQRSRR